MSAVFLAKVEIKEKEDSAKNKGNDINGENKTIKKMVRFYLLQFFCSQGVNCWYEAEQFVIQK